MPTRTITLLLFQLRINLLLKSSTILESFKVSTLNILSCAIIWNAQASTRFLLLTNWNLMVSNIGLYIQSMSRSFSYTKITKLISDSSAVCLSAICVALNLLFSLKNAERLIY